MKIHRIDLEEIMLLSLQRFSSQAIDDGAPDYGGVFHLGMRHSDYDYSRHHLGKFNPAV
ncbi:MAG: hypothetical protein QW797_06575 [Thermoproteota archaeon]